MTKAMISIFAVSALLAGSLYAGNAAAQATVAPAPSSQARPNPGDNSMKRNLPAVAPQRAQASPGTQGNAVQRSTGTNDTTASTPMAKKKTTKKAAHHTQKPNSSKSSAKKKSTTPTSTSTTTGNTTTGSTTTSGGTTTGGTTTGSSPQKAAAPVPNSSGQGAGAPATAPSTGATTQ